MSVPGVVDDLRLVEHGSIGQIPNGGHFPEGVDVLDIPFPLRLVTHVDLCISWTSSSPKTRNSRALGLEDLE